MPRHGSRHGRGLRRAGGRHLRRRTRASVRRVQRTARSLRSRRKGGILGGIAASLLGPLVVKGIRKLIKKKRRRRRR